MMKKSKVELEKQKAPYMGVQTRSKSHALESLQTRSRKCKKVAGGASSGEVKKRQKKGGSGSKSSKGKGKGKGKRKVDVVSDEERVVEEEGEINDEGMDDLGGVDDAGEDVGDAKGDVDENAATTGGLPSESTDEHFSISSEYRAPCSDTKGDEFVADERPQTDLGGNSHQHKEMTIEVLPQDFNGYSPTAPSSLKLPSRSTDEHLSISSEDRAPCASTKGDKVVADEMPQTDLGGNSHQHKEMTIEVLPKDFNLYSPTPPSMEMLPSRSHNEQFSISSGYKPPCSSTKDAKSVADERPQTDLGGNLHQHKEMTTDVLPEDFNLYSPTPPSMQKYNFDVENEKPPPGHLETAKKQPSPALGHVKDYRNFQV